MFETYEELVETLAELAWADLRGWSDDEVFEAVITLARLRPIVSDMIAKVRSQHEEGGVDGEPMTPGSTARVLRRVPA
jgi:hypothetical protein